MTIAVSSRDAILQRVRGALASGPALRLPPVAPVWPSAAPTPQAMTDRFVPELTLVQGEVVRAATIEQARRELVELVQTAGWTSLGAMDRPLVREATAELPPGMVRWAAADWEPRQVERLSASLIEPLALLADTGSCLVACPTAQDRLLCYLPPACVVVARLEQLAEHLPAAWPAVTAMAADPALRGELVILTGPSRTADIEKVLILGVHGPKRLVVLLIGRD
jgi:L-lactate dehydrogenase complex protein LldG